MSTNSKNIMGISTGYVILVVSLMMLCCVMSTTQAAPYVINSKNNENNNNNNNSNNNRPRQNVINNVKHTRHPHLHYEDYMDKISSVLFNLDIYHTNLINTQFLETIHSSCNPKNFADLKSPRQNIKPKFSGPTITAKIDSALRNLLVAEEKYVDRIDKLMSYDIHTDKNFNTTARNDFLKNIKCLTGNFHLEVKTAINKSTVPKNICNNVSKHVPETKRYNFTCVVDRQLFNEMKSHLEPWKKQLNKLKGNLKKKMDQAIKKSEKNKKNGKNKPKNPNRTTKAPSNPNRPKKNQ